MSAIESLHARFLECTGTCTDTRNITAGAMFFALRGPSFDANSFALEAVRQGCRYAVVDDPALKGRDHCIVVDDVLAALQELARHHRRGFDLPVLAITGSNGKTTTKELVHAAMNADRPALATVGNLNNHIGVPLTLLRLSQEHRFAIIEMGANHVGEIAALCKIAEPTHGLITNIGKAHLEGFGGLKGVIKAKTELYGWLARCGGLAFVNTDDPLLMERSAGLLRVTYGSGTDADVRGGDLDRPDGFLSIELAEPPRVLDLNLVGRYNTPNVLAAVCVARHFAVPEATIAGALAGYVPSNNRSQFTDTGRNRVVMDAYNANPSSMRAALENFAAISTAGSRLAILGDMLELGPESAAEHAGIAELSQKLGIPTILVGPEFAGPAAAHHFEHYMNASQALAALEARHIEGSFVLVKGSRGLKLETLYPAL